MHIDNVPNDYGTILWSENEIIVVVTFEILSPEMSTVTVEQQIAEDVALSVICPDCGFMNVKPSGTKFI